MRRPSLALALFSAFAVIACGGEAPSPVAPQAPITEPPAAPTIEPAQPSPAPTSKRSLQELQKETIDGALRALNGRDAKLFASAYAEGAVLAVAGFDEVNGRAAIEQNVREWLQTFEDLKLGFSRVWTMGDTVVLEWVINGKHRGELFGVKDTDQPIGHAGLSVLTFDGDGKIASEHRYGDLGVVMTQVAGRATKVKPRPIPAMPEAPEAIAPKATDERARAAVVDLAKSVLASLESGKKEAEFLSLLSDEVEQEGLFYLETSKGKAGAKKLFKSFTTAFPNAKFEIKKALAIGDYAIVESVLTATHEGPLGTIPATKRPIAVHLVDVFEIADGKVARAWRYQNGLELQQQLGLFKPPTGNLPASQASSAKPAKSGTPAVKAIGGDGHGGGKGTGGGGGKGTGGGGRKEGGGHGHGDGTGGGGGDGTGGGGGKGTGGRRN